MNIPYQIKISKRAKRIILRVKSAKLIVVTPKEISEHRVSKLIAENKDWILSTIEEQQDSLKVGITISDGSEITIMDKAYSVRLLHNQSSAKTSFIDTELVINSPDNSHVTELIRWLRKRYKKIISTRVQTYAKTFGYEVVKVTLRDQSTRWGSCSTNGTISLNWRLIFAPTAVLDYVIIHELAHLKHMNHSKDFWSEVERMMPDYKTYKRWLRQNGQTLSIVT